MRELDINTQTKNAIEEEKLAKQLKKLTRSGTRAALQIDRDEEGVAKHFIDVTCKTNKVTDVRKQRTFQIMKLEEKPARPSTTGGLGRGRRGGKGAAVRPMSSVHYIPTNDGGSDDEMGEKYAKQDTERINRERSDKFYHHKLNKLINMMNDRTNKRRAKSAPSPRKGPPAPPPYDIHNLPDTILEHRPMTRGDAEFELKKMRNTIQKQPSLLYGEIKTDTIVKKQYNPNRTGGLRRDVSRSSLQSQQSGRRISSSTQERRKSSIKRRVSTAKDRSNSRDQTTEPPRRVSTAQSDRRHPPSPPLRRTSFKPPTDWSSSDSDSDSSLKNLSPRRPPRSDSPPPPDPSYYNAMGLKLREFQDGRYPSRFLDPNPDFYSRQKPYPVLFDRKLQDKFDKFCKKMASMKTISQSKKDLQEIIEEAEQKHEKIEVWDPRYVSKNVWSSRNGDTEDIPWDNGPKF